MVAEFGRAGWREEFPWLGFLGLLLVVFGSVWVLECSAGPTHHPSVSLPPSLGLVCLTRGP